MGNLNAFRAPGCRLPEQTHRQKGKPNRIDVNNPSELGLKGTNLARRAFSGRSRLSMGKGNSVACVADALNLYKWRGPAATRARDHVFFPSRALISRLATSRRSSYPGRKKKASEARCEEEKF